MAPKFFTELSRRWKPSIDWLSHCHECNLIARPTSTYLKCTGLDSISVNLIADSSVAEHLVRAHVVDDLLYDRIEDVGRKI
jgi:hypothetical protein